MQITLREILDFELFEPFRSVLTSYKICWITLTSSSMKRVQLLSTKAMTMVEHYF